MQLYPLKGNPRVMYQAMHPGHNECTCLLSTVSVYNLNTPCSAQYNVAYTIKFADEGQSGEFEKNDLSKPFPSIGLRISQCEIDM